MIGSTALGRLALTAALSWVALSWAAIWAAPSSAQGLGEAYADAEGLTTEAKLSQAEQEIAAMRGTLDFTLKRLEKARQNKDIIQVNCVNEKLSAIKGLLRISEQARTGLQEAAGRNDDELINHEYTKITLAGLRVENFRVEVDGCVGELSQYTGSTQLDLEVSDEIRDDDPSATATEPVFVASEIERPPTVTGSQ